jgi:hypothetical protein
MSLVVRAAPPAVALALGLATTAPCQAAPQEAWSRNPRGFELGINQADTGDVWGVTLRACHQPACFQIRAKLAVKANSQTGVWEMTLPIAAGACDLKIVNVPHGEMDSNDWRITALPVSPGGCASAPAGVGGVYRSEPP